MRAFKKSGYSREVADQYVDSNKPVTYVTSFAEKQYRYEDNRRTDEVSGYRYWFFQEGLNPFQVKFPKTLNEGLNPFDELNFDGLEGIEIRGNVYFRADDVKPAKGKSNG
ncbi:hypothetical protein [Lacticaseibacillus paracasei]|uniref:hypothetical protein n=1 Tax=Lacticaseibacillus paracasei TaxID=1597 RepID=UPI0021C3905B|nr:hypothetical protein [Lacticaseibacillus paracasei]MCP9309815.1 hypothetical protein [Lacticaseibacillus paracasei]MCP9346562.1 hypothetical protein [Lacticaseibacillus paracasei]MCP9366162.1 hypothetical protein [Lacticaseibacillus paracasei]MCP9378542.1 hypothetical protein [Lacticaseibacillus paracasei]